MGRWERGKRLRVLYVPTFPVIAVARDSVLITESLDQPTTERLEQELQGLQPAPK